MKKVQILTILEAVGAFVFGLICFSSADDLKKCILWGIVLLVWVGFFEVKRRAQKKKGE